MKFSPFVLLTFAFSLLSLNAQDATDRTLVGDERAGAITKDTSRADLDEIYGRRNVIDATLPGPEGTEFEGTIIFPDNDAEKIEVIWTSEEKTRPEFVRVGGDQTSWHTDAGLTLGMSLKEVHELNGKDFTILGFDWDYGGFVSSFNGGGLDGGPSIRFATKEGDDTSNVAGDTEFLSSLPALQRLNPTVSEITVMLSRPVDENAPGEVEGLTETKTSTSPLEVGEEVPAFVQRMIESNEELSVRYEGLIAKRAEAAGGRFQAGEWKAIEWLVPNLSSSFRDGKGERDGESIYLVQQQLQEGFRGGYSVNDNIVVRVRAFFHEDHGYNEKKDEYFLTKSTLTLTFEGFVTVKVTTE